jgi:hypothetical protein
VARDKLQAFWGSMARLVPPPLLIILASIFYFLIAHQRAIWGNNWDEPVYLYSGWLASRGFNPYALDLGFYVNPPLLPWLLATIYRIAGFNLLLMRVVAALFLIGGLYLVFLIGRLIKDDVAGYAAVLLIAVQPIFIWFGRCVQLENFSLFFDVAAVWIYLSSNQKRRSTARNWAVGLMLALSLGLKLQAAVVVIGFGFYLLLTRRWRDLLHIALSTLIFSLVWLIIARWAYGPNVISAMLVTLARGDKWDHHFVSTILQRAPIMIAIAAPGLIICLATRSLKQRSLLLICILASAAIVFYMANAFWTYMMLAWFPWLALISGTGLSAITDRINLKGPWLEMSSILRGALPSGGMLIVLLLLTPTHIIPFEDGNMRLRVSRDAPSIFERRDDFDAMQCTAAFIRSTTGEDDWILSDPYVALWSGRRTPEGCLPWVLGEHVYVLEQLQSKGLWQGLRDIRNDTKDYEEWWEIFADMAYDDYFEMLETRPEIKAVVYPSIYGIWDMPWPIDSSDLHRRTDFRPAFKCFDELSGKEYEVWLRQG